MNAIYITDEDMPADEVKTLAERRTIALMRAYELLHEKCRITEKRIVQLSPEQTFALCQIMATWDCSRNKRFEKETAGAFPGNRLLTFFPEKALQPGPKKDETPPIKKNNWVTPNVLKKRSLLRGNGVGLLVAKKLKLGESSAQQHASVPVALESESTTSVENA